MPTSLECALSELNRALGPSKLLDASHFERSCHDESEVPAALPDAVVLAGCTDDVARCLAICDRYGVPVVRARAKLAVLCLSWAESS